jgi:hypothetical protein
MAIQISLQQDDNTIYISWLACKPILKVSGVCPHSIHFLI